MADESTNQEPESQDAPEEVVLDDTGEGTPTGGEPPQEAEPAETEGTTDETPSNDNHDGEPGEEPGEESAGNPDEESHPDGEEATVPSDDGDASGDDGTDSDADATDSGDDIAVDSDADGQHEADAEESPAEPADATEDEDTTEDDSESLAEDEADRQPATAPDEDVTAEVDNVDDEIIVIIDQDDIDEPDEQDAPDENIEEAETSDNDGQEPSEEDGQPADDDIDQKRAGISMSPWPFVILLAGAVAFVVSWLVIRPIMDDMADRNVPTIVEPGRLSEREPKAGSGDGAEGTSTAKDTTTRDGKVQDAEAPDLTDDDKADGKIDDKTSDKANKKADVAEGDDKDGNGDSPEAEQDGDETDAPSGDDGRRDGNGIKYGRGRRDDKAKKLADSDTTDLTEGQRAVISSANSTRTAGASMCLAWVNDVFDRTQWDFDRLWAASEACQEWCYSTDRKDLKPGMIVAVESTDTSPIAGHIGIYIGDGMIRDNETWGGEGVVMTRPLDEWLEMFSKVDTPRWGWAGNCDLSIEGNYPVRDESDGDESDGDADADDGQGDDSTNEE